jgi:hypothetical protein
VTAKTYLVYCSSKNPSDKETHHHHFEYLIQASSADDAEEKCRARLKEIPTHVELFEKGTIIYVDYIVEIAGVPAEGALLRYVRYKGELASISKSLPLEEGAGMIASYLTEDPEKQSSSPVPPFVVLS